MLRPKMILIDLDGTLVDSVPDLAYCVDEMMIRLGRPPRGAAAVRNWVGNGVERLVRRALTGELDGEPPDADYALAYPLFLELYSENTSGRSMLYPGVREGLDYLRDLAELFRGDAALVAAAYNAGEHAVVKHGVRRQMV